MSKEEKDTLEKQLFNLDWSSLTEQEQTELVVKQTVYFELIKNVARHSAIHASDIRNLLTSMLTVIFLSFWEVDIKNIIMSLLGLQVVFVVLSRISLFIMTSQLEIMKNSYIDFLKKKQ